VVHLPTPTPIRRGARAAAPALAALALALAGCPPPKAPPPELGLDPGPLLLEVRAAQARCATVAGEARVTVAGPGGAGTVTQLVQAAKPDRLRIDVLDFFGGPVARLAAEGGRLVVFDAREKACYRGAATPENVARLVPVALPVPDLATLLCGSAPVAAGAEPLRAAPGDGVVELTLAAPGGVEQTLGIGAGATVTWSRLRRGGERVPGTYDVSFAERRAAGGITFPLEATLRARAEGVEVKLLWKEVEPNATPAEGAFALECPRGARIVELD
jgi:hypothetical protein